MVTKFSALCLAVALFPIVSFSQSARPLPGHVPEVVSRLQPLSDVAPQTPLHLSIGLPLRNKQALTNFIRDLYNPNSPQFHRYLSTAQFTENFGPTADDYQKTQDYLSSQGFKVTATHPNRMVLEVTAAAADIEKTFHTHLRQYRHPTEQRNFFAPDSTPSVDPAIPILDVMGLDNYILPHPMDLRTAFTNATVTNYAETGSGPGGTYIGTDFRTAYVPGVTNTGAGQYIGLVEFGAYYTNDIHTYEVDAKLPTNLVVSNIFLDGVTEPPSSGTDAGEQALDIEMCLAMAPGATVLYYGGNVVDDIYSRIASDNLAKQISCSFGFGIDSTTEQLYQEFVTQGQNFFVASGDAGAYVGTINPPAAEPYITIVGGTALYTVSPGGAYQQELAWVGSGGGVSTFYSIPDYQQGINMAPLQGSSTMRNFPDVSMMADTVIFLAANNGTGPIGGTSASSPEWAAFYSLANQQAAALGQPPLGFFNPALYALGKSANYTKCFHDITSGNTTNFSSGPKKFFAATGYDLATGWGSPTGSNLINALTAIGSNNAFLYASPTTVLLTAGGSATVLITDQPMNVSSVPISLSISNLPPGVTASFNPASTSTTSILTLSSSTLASAGTSTLTLIGSSESVTQTTLLTLSIESNAVTTSEVNLSANFNLAAIFNDGSSFTTGGADGGGNAYSANLIGTGLSWNGSQFLRGPANGNDAIQCSGQTIRIPPGPPSAIQILAAAVDGAQPSQPFIVNYTDGTKSTFVQSISDWTTSGNYPGESVVIATPYRDTSSGTKDTVTEAYIYGYSFALNNTKGAESITLPNNSQILVFAISVVSDFTIYGEPSNMVVAAGGNAATYLVSAPVSGVPGSVTLSVTNLPAGVTATFSPASSTTGSVMTLTAAATAQPATANLTISGSLNGITHNTTLKYSTVTPIPGQTEVNLTSAYNLVAIVRDGTSFSSTGGLDSAGNAYSFNLLGSAPNWDCALFAFGPAGSLDAVQATGQTLSLPTGQYTGLFLLAAAVSSNQPSQIFQINYTDGTSATVTQSVSLWTAPQNYPGESVAFSTDYSDTADGTNNPNEPVNLYGYILNLNDTKTVQSITLPNNPNLVVVAMTLGNAPTPVSLSGSFNRAGIYTDGTAFSGGFDNDGAAYSSIQLGSSLIWDSAQFTFGPANASDVINCSGQNIPLPTNHYTSLLILAAAVNGSQTSQPFTVTYTDGAIAHFAQSIADWVSAPVYSNQFTAISMPYRLQGTSPVSGAYLFGYIFPLNNTKIPRTLTLPNNSDVNVLAISLANTPLPVNIASNYNRAGIYTDGTHFASGTGMDNDGSALSATLLGGSQVWHNTLLGFGPSNVTNVISAAGQTVALPQGQYSSLLMLGLAVNGSQASQTFTVNYTNNTSTAISVSLSDWVNSSSYSGETKVVQMPYRDSSGGSESSPAVNLYGYTLNLNSNLVLQSIKLPSDANVEVISLTLSNYTGAIPGITSLSTNQTVTNGGSASFSVTAVGSPPLKYQWDLNGTNISGATTATLSIPSTTPNNAGSYTVIVSSPYGSVTSSVVTLTVVVPPAITNQPISLTVTNGTPALFTVGATGTAPLAYQWQWNGTNLTDGPNITGSLTSSLAFAGTQSTNAGSYDVIITNAYGAVTSAIATLNVVFLFQPPTTANGLVNFSWLTTPGETYQIQYTTDLTTSNWLNLGPSIVATNTITLSTDPLTNAPARFYRILQQ